MNPPGETLQAVASEPLPAPPPVAVRGERFLVFVDQALARLDGWLARALPADLNPLAQSGRAANFMLLVAVVSGVFMLLWYSPSLQLAYPSLAALGSRTLGGWVRAVHRYSSDLVMLFLVVHAARMFFARKFASARWIPWVSGVGLIALVWFIGWTGYWLVWDQPAQQVAVTSMRLLDGLPIFGEPMARLYVADRTVPSLLFFVVFFLHMLLPLGIAVGLAVHLLRLSRVRLLPTRHLSVALAAGLFLASWAMPAPLDAPAQMAVKAKTLTVDAWYLSPLALGLRFRDGGLWVALFGSCAIGAALPWLLRRRRRPEAYQTAVDTSRCHACTQCKQDCPFDAIEMVPRTDGKRFASHAQVDPARCVGCGVCVGSCDSEAMSLLWFDTRREEARIESEIAAAQSAGAAQWVAFVAGDIDGGFPWLASERWRQRLPDYHVQFIPTASWLRSILVERLLKSGVRGVLVIRDARAEAAARDGNQWVLARLTGQRNPAFRPERSGAAGGVWRVLDYDPSRPAELIATAAAFCRPQESAAASSSRGWRWLRSASVAALLALALAAATIAPSHLKVKNPDAHESEFVFSFKAFGAFVEQSATNAAEDALKPVHMRGRSTSKPRRSEVVVRLAIDGATQERTYRAKGISRDGPAIDAWHATLAPGDRQIAIELAGVPETEPQRWSGVITAERGRLHVVTYVPGDGFRVEE